MTVTEDISEDVEDFDFGWVIGAGAGFRRVSLDARYTFGLRNIDATGDDIVTARSR